MEKNPALNFLESVLYQLESYKTMTEKAFEQLDDEQLHWHQDDHSLSIATIMKHLSANMLSRWTDFLTTDGEKEWRRVHRDEEFIDTIADRQELLKTWNQGWNSFMEALKPLTPDDLCRIVYIRNEGYTVIEAIHRGLGHAAYHVGQIVYLAKMFKSEDWQSLSIPKGASVAFNQEKFSRKKSRRKF
jgi:hypothetical protein